MTTGWEADTSRDAWVRQITPTGASHSWSACPTRVERPGFSGLSLCVRLKWDTSDFYG